MARHHPHPPDRNDKNGRNEKKAGRSGNGNGNGNGSGGSKQPPVPEPIPFPAPSAAATKAKPGTDKAVIAVLRADLARRTGGMPAALREKILASVRPAPRLKKPRDTGGFLNLGYTGTLLAATLAMSVGVAWYLQNQPPVDLNAAKSTVRPTSVWDVAREDGLAALDGRMSLSPATPALRLRPWVETPDAAWTLAGVRTDVGGMPGANLFVFGDGRERRAVLVFPLRSARGGSAGDLGIREQPTARTESRRLLLGFAEGDHGVIVLGGGPLDRLGSFARGLELRDAE
jgi:hypothetical protein